jgi:hypothetical protein
MTPPGDGYRTEVVVTSQTVDSESFPTLWRYFSPSISSLSPTVASPLAVDEVLRVRGDNFGFDAEHGSVSVGGRLCGVLTWSNTYVTCRMPIGVVAASPVVVSYRGLSSPVVAGDTAILLQYVAPQVHVVTPRVVGTTGGMLLNITGRHFCHPLPVTVWLSRRGMPTTSGSWATDTQHVLPCRIVNGTVTPTALQCSVSAGVDADWTVVVVNHNSSAASWVDMQAGSNASVRVSYAAPNVTAVSVVASASGMIAGSVAAPAVGGFLIRVDGGNFTDGAVVRFADGDCRRVGAVSPLHDSVVCVASPCIVGGPTPVVVSAGSQGSNAVSLECDGPVVERVEPLLFPALQSSTRERVRVYGANFGVRRSLQTPPHIVTVGNATCSSVVWLSDGEVHCQLSVDVVPGLHNVTVSIAGRSSHSSSASVVRAVCPEGTFEVEGVACVGCPDGAECAGGRASPVARVGYFPLSRAVFVPCQPPSACRGGVNNTCSRHYVGFRCADCDVGAYRCGGWCTLVLDCWALFCGIVC